MFGMKSRILIGWFFNEFASNEKSMNQDFSKWANEHYPEISDDTDDVDLERYLRSVCVRGASFAGKIPVSVNRTLHRLSPPNKYLRYFLNRAKLTELGKGAFAQIATSGGVRFRGEAVRNILIAERAGISYNEKVKDYEIAYSEAERNRIISATISRHYRHARQMIEQAGKGVFPF